MIYILAFILSFAVVVLLIPPLGRLAHKLDFVDKPREDVERKLHRQPIPLTASYAIFTGFFLTYIALTKELTWETAALVVGGMLLLTIGTIDDWYKTKGKDFPALPKMIIQVSAAVLVLLRYCVHRIRESVQCRIRAPANLAAIYPDDLVDFRSYDGD